MCAAALPALARDNDGEGREVRSTVARGIDAIELSAPVDVEVVSSGSADGTVVYRTAAADDPLVIERQGTKLVVRAAKPYTRGRDMKMKSSVKVCCGSGIVSVNVTGSGDVSIPAISTGRNVDLVVTGSGDIKVQSVKASAIKAKVTGSGDIKVQSLKADEGDFAVTGSGDIEVAGNAGSVGADLTGAGDIDLKKLQAATVKVRLTGVGDVTCKPKAELDADLRGTGGVTVYGGRPARVTLSGNTRNVIFKNN